MTESPSSSGLALSRALVSTLLLGEPESLEGMVSEEDPEVLRHCIGSLVGMVSAQVTRRSTELDVEPIDLWRSIISKSMIHTGF